MGTVALIDGRIVDSASEEWRAECEARYVARLPTRQERRRYVDAVRARRGDAAADELIELVYRVFDDARSAQANREEST